MAKAKAVKKVLDLTMTAKGLVPTKASTMPTPVVVTEVASTAVKLTKRNATALTAVLEQTEKVPRNRVGHTSAAWDALVKLLPATAAELCKLPELAAKECVSPQAFVSYMIRRGNLRVKASD